MVSGVKDVVILYFRKSQIYNITLIDYCDVENYIGIYRLGQYWYPLVDITFYPIPQKSIIV